MAKPKATGFQFPFTFTLRALGEDRDDFAGLVLSIVQRHVPDLNDEVVSIRPSREGRYISVLVTFSARDRAQLDDIYRDLSEEQRVLMVL